MTGGEIFTVVLVSVFGFGALYVLIESAEEGRIEEQKRSEPDSFQQGFLEFLRRIRWHIEHRSNGGR